MDNVEQARAHGAYAVAAEDLELMQYAKFTPKAEPPLYQGMYNTAYGAALAWRLTAFWGEAVSGFFMLLDLFVIWFFSKERDVSVPEEFPDVNSSSSSA